MPATISSQAERHRPRPPVRAAVALAMLSILTMVGCGANQPVAPYEGAIRVDRPAVTPTTDNPAADACSRVLGTTSAQRIAADCRSLDDLTAALLPSTPGFSHEKAAGAAEELAKEVCRTATGPLCVSLR